MADRTIMPVTPRLLLVAAIFLLPAPSLQAQQDNDAGGNQDAPSRVARIAYAQGNVSLEPAGVDAFAAAELNYPLTNGDRIFVDPQSLGELQTAGLAIRLANGADLTVSSLTDWVAQFGLNQGSIRLRTRDLYAPPSSDGQLLPAVVEVDTPNSAILIQQPGDIRVDAYPQDDSTVVTVSSGVVEVSGGGFDQQIQAGQALRLVGSNPVTVQPVNLLPPDNLDNFDTARESERDRSNGYHNQYVDPEMIGAADLDQYGDWQPDTSYGAVWYPRVVPFGWVPYSVGRWAWIAPWGWTWIESEPWGFAPFHYGRWNNFNGRWGWIPGPPPGVLRSGFGGRPPRPVYSPALVAFVGGPRISVALGFGGDSGAGVTAWFPLGPREPYTPWYHASPAYVNRVNVTNIYTTNATDIHNTYVNRSSTVYNTSNIAYVNRTVATVAVPQRDFAAGHSVAQSTSLHLDAGARQQLAQAPILPHPLVTPAPAIANPHAPARALPPTVARPVIVARQGVQRSGPPTQPHSTMLPANIYNVHPASPIQPQQGQSQPAPPRPTQTQSTPNRGNGAEAGAPRTEPAQPVNNLQPIRQSQPRPLVTVTPPQPAQPSFNDQRRAIEENDPGRPLGPQQMNNLRDGRPAGPPSQPEAAPHPPPAERPAARPAPPPQPKPTPPR